MANKTVHRDNNIKSTISTMDLNDPLDTYEHHIVSWDMYSALPKKMLDSLKNSPGFNHLRFAVLDDNHVNSNKNQLLIPDYKQWFEGLISDNKILKSIELVSQFKIYTNIVKNNLIIKEYHIIDIFINNSEFKAIFIVNENDVVNDEFINDFYDLAFKYEEEFRETFKKEINFSFVGNEDIDHHELNIDKFFKLEDGE